MRSLPAVLFAATVFLTLVAVDARAEASFDAPKRLVAMFGIAVSIAALAFTRADRRAIPRKTDAPRGAGESAKSHRAITLSATVALLLILASAWFSPHRAVALDAVRTIVVFAAAGVLAASDARVWRWATHAFVAGAALNAAISLLQAARLAEPLRYASGGGRGAVSALIGNTGVLGLICAFALLLLAPRLTRRAYGMWALVALLGAALIVNRSLTPFAVVVAGLLVYVPWRRSALAAAVLIFSLAATGLAHRIDESLSFRFAPWRAAWSMAIERPLLGYGAGTYAAEFVRHHDGRFVNPHLAGSYAQAHNEYLQAAAELGVPATLLLLAILVLLMRGARHDIVTLSVLAGGAVAALTWFPLQRPETALLLLAACGRAWRDE